MSEGGRGGRKGGGPPGGGEKGSEGPGTLESGFTNSPTQPKGNRLPCRLSPCPEHTDKWQKPVLEGPVPG